MRWQLAVAARGNLRLSRAAAASGSRPAAGQQSTEQQSGEIKTELLLMVLDGIWHFKRVQVGWLKESTVALALAVSASDADRLCDGAPEQLASTAAIDLHTLGCSGEGHPSCMCDMPGH